MLLARSTRFKEDVEETPGPIYDPEKVQLNKHIPRLPTKPPDDAPKEKSRIPWTGRRIHVKNDVCIIGQGAMDIAYLDPKALQPEKTPAARIAEGPRFDIYVEKTRKTSPGPNAYMVNYTDIANNTPRPRTAEEEKELRKKKAKQNKLAKFHGRPYDPGLTPGPGQYSVKLRPSTTSHRIGTGRRWLGNNEYLGRAYERKNLATFGPGPKYNVADLPMNDGEQPVKSVSSYQGIGMKNTIDTRQVVCEKAQARHTWQMGVRVNGYMLRRNEEEVGSQLGPGAYMMPTEFGKKSFNSRVNKNLKVINKVDIKNQPDRNDKMYMTLEKTMATAGDLAGGVDSKENAEPGGDEGDAESVVSASENKKKRRRRKKKKKGPLWIEGDKFTETGRDIVKRYREKKAAMTKMASQPKMMFGTQARGHHSEQVRAFSGMRQGTRNQVMQHMLHLYDDGDDEAPNWNLA